MTVNDELGLNGKSHRGLFEAIVPSLTWKDKKTYY
jgi:hypothetical protein